MVEIGYLAVIVRSMRRDGTDRASKLAKADCHALKITYDDMIRLPGPDSYFSCWA